MASFNSLPPEVLTTILEHVAIQGSVTALRDLTLASPICARILLHSPHCNTRLKRLAVRSYTGAFFNLARVLLRAVQFADDSAAVVGTLTVSDFRRKCRTLPQELREVVELGTDLEGGGVGAEELVRIYKVHRKVLGILLVLWRRYGRVDPEKTGEECCGRVSEEDADKERARKDKNDDGSTETADSEVPKCFCAKWRVCVSCEKDEIREREYLWNASSFLAKFEALRLRVQDTARPPLGPSGMECPFSTADCWSIYSQLILNNVMRAVRHSGTNNSLDRYYQELAEALHYIYETSTLSRYIPEYKVQCEANGFVRQAFFKYFEDDLVNSGLAREIFTSPSTIITDMNEVIQITVSYLQGGLSPDDLYWYLSLQDEEVRKKLLRAFIFGRGERRRLEQGLFTLSHMLS